MAKHGLNSFNARGLSRTEFSQLNSDTVAEIKAFLKSHSKDALLTAQCTKTERALQAYQLAQEALKPTGLSGRLEKADAERDLAFQTFNAFFRANAYIKTAAVQEAHRKLQGLVEDYRKQVKKSYEVQSQHLNKLIAELKSPANQAAVNQLNLAPHVAAMEAAQTHFTQVYKERVTEQAAFTPGQLKDKRIELAKAYRLLVEAVAISAAIHTEQQAYQDLLKRINALRSRYRKAQKKKADKDTSPETGQE